MVLMCLLSGSCQSFDFNDRAASHHGCLSLSSTPNSRNTSWYVKFHFMQFTRLVLLSDAMEFVYYVLQEAYCNYLKNRSV